MTTRIRGVEQAMAWPWPNKGTNQVWWYGTIGFLVRTRKGLSVGDKKGPGWTWRVV